LGEKKKKKKKEKGGAELPAKGSLRGIPRTQGTSKRKTTGDIRWEPDHTWGTYQRGINGTSLLQGRTGK